MGSKQKAVEAFLAVCDTMLDRWIPDEDWVRQIRNDSGNNCLVADLNYGMSKQCEWHNNHATLLGWTIFYNTKKVRISKTPEKRKKIKFYYVLGKVKPAPTVPSDQGFYQSLWDDFSRSNRPLKRTAPSQANIASATQPPTKMTPPPTKKAKASSTLPILPETTSNRPLSPSTPESLEEASRINKKKGVRDIKLGNGVVVFDVPDRYEIVLDSDLARFRRERGLVTALKEVLGRSNNQPTQYTKHLLAAFAASHPQISVMYQELLISLARYTFL
jgi:hypothetical protein